MMNAAACDANWDLCFTTRPLQNINLHLLVILLCFRSLKEKTEDPALARSNHVTYLQLINGHRRHSTHISWLMRRWKNNDGVLHGAWQLQVFPRDR